MDTQYHIGYTAFKGNKRLVSGDLKQVAACVKEAFTQGVSETLLVFKDLDGEVVDLDLRGTMEDVLKRVREAAPGGGSTKAAEEIQQVLPRGPGRPRLGVVSREVTLLPRHWAWLNSQPGGASVVLRRLVDEARRQNSTKDRVRRSREAAYRFMSSMAGDLPGYEEALRALFSGNKEGLMDSTAQWPLDIRDYAVGLAKEAFQAGPETQACQVVYKKGN